MRRIVSSLAIVALAIASVAALAAGPVTDTGREVADELPPFACVYFDDIRVPGTGITIDKRYDNLCVDLPSTRPYRPDRTEAGTAQEPGS